MVDHGVLKNTKKLNKNGVITMYLTLGSLTIILNCVCWKFHQMWILEFSWNCIISEIIICQGCQEHFMHLKRCLSTGTGLSKYWSPCLSTGHFFQVRKSSLSMLIYAGIPNYVWWHGSH